MENLEMPGKTMRTINALDDNDYITIVVHGREFVVIPKVSFNKLNKKNETKN